MHTQLEATPSFDLKVDLETADWLDEVKIIGSTVATFVLRGQLGEAESEVFRIHQRLFALIALDTPRTARTGSEQIKAIHRADLVGVAVPGGHAVATDDLIGADQTPQTNSHHIRREIVLGLDGKSSVAELDRREEEGAIQEWELVIHGHPQAAEDAVDEAGAVVSETAQDEGASVVPRPIPIILHLYVVGVDQVSG